MAAGPDDAHPEQPELLPGLVRATLKQSQAKARATRERKAAEAETAAVLPVARVLVDVPLAHLDRPFDFSVPAAMADDAVPGVRVKVRFAGKETDGFLVERHGETASLRWILLHLVEEYARHAGHADLIRESVDGATGL